MNFRAPRRGWDTLDIKAPDDADADTADVADVADAADAPDQPDVVAPGAGALDVDDDLDLWLLLGLAAAANANANAEAKPAVELRIGLVVLRLRLYRGWSQSELERRSRVDQSTISRLERGKQRGLALHRLAAILRALRVGEISFLPPAPVVPPTSLELMLRGDPWERAIADADKRLNRRRSA